MNRAMWLRILTVAVVAPYLYKLSGDERGYFAVGLKLLAGGLLAVNVVPLIADAKVLRQQASGFLQQVAAAQDTLNKNQRVPVTVEAENATDAEYSES